MTTRGTVQMEFHVSASGSDAADGSLTDPFRTIERAQSAVRRINRDMTGDIIVHLRGGVHERNHPVRFVGEDSGTNGHHVVYRAFSGETSVVSGGRRVTGWRRVADSAISDLWVADVPDVEYSRHFFVEGRNASRAKGLQAETTGWTLLEDPEMRFDNPLETVETFQGNYTVFEGYRTTRAELATWKNPRDVEFVYKVGWTHVICPVDSVDPTEDGAFIRMRMPCFRDCQSKSGCRIGSPSYIENAFELLSDPGEWYFRRDTRQLFYIPLPGEDLERAETILPGTEKLIELQGTLDSPVHHIRFEGLAFRHTTFLRPGRLGHAEVQSNLIKDPDEDQLRHASYLTTPSAILLDAAFQIGFEDCDFSLLGSGAIDIQNGSQDNWIRGNRFRQLAATGIQVGGFTLKEAHPEDPRTIVRDNAIVNNLFDGIGTDFRGSCGILAGYAEGTLIAHNEIRNIAYSGISVGWGWGYWDADTARIGEIAPPHYPRFTTPTVSARNRIESNHIHHVMQKLHDGAGIYTLSMQPESSIRGNVIHDNGDADGHIPGLLEYRGVDGEEFTPEFAEVRKANGFPGGIYLDECSGGFEVTENIVYNVPLPFFYHEVCEKGRFETIDLHDNHFGVKPRDLGYPAGIERSAGLEEGYRHLAD